MKTMIATQIDLTFLILLFAVFFHCIAFAAVNQVSYLMQFGYLPGSDYETGINRTDYEIREALMKFQKMAHIPMTGQMDANTEKMMTTSRCGMQDMVDGKLASFVAGPSKWDKTTLTYKIINFSPDLSASDIRRTMHDAFQVWSNVTPLTFTEVAPQSEADIEISFGVGYHGDPYAFDGQGMVLAHAFYPGSMRGGDCHFDDDEYWTLRQFNGVNLFIVAAHELGHALGLSHSETREALMYPYYSGYNPNFKLHADDIAGIQYLYGTPSFPKPTRIPEVPTVPPTTTIRPDVAPDLCYTDFDTITTIRGDTYLFKGKWFWKIDQCKSLSTKSPKLFRSQWIGLPESVQRVDAAFERQTDKKTIIISGNRYWQFSGFQLSYRFPAEGYPLRYLQIPDSITSVDAVFVWNYNGRVYLISGDIYWRYDAYFTSVDRGYPKSMSLWKGVPLPIDTAFTDMKGYTYFVRGRSYWAYNDEAMAVEHYRGKQLDELLNLPCITAPYRSSSTSLFATTMSSALFKLFYIVLVFPVSLQLA